LTLLSTSRSQLKLLLLSALKNSARDERGSALFEAGISMLVLLMLMFGVIEASLAVYSFHFVANAAHEATRYATVRGGSWTATCDGTGTAGSGYGASMCQASPADIENYVATRNFPGVNITTSDVCVEYFSSVPSSVSTTCSANSSPNAAGDIVQVTVTYPFTLHVPGLPAYTVNLSSTSQSVIAQ
jgi:Flp pilus assembly protein TadG